jgi:hypothetical protein
MIDKRVTITKQEGKIKPPPYKLKPPPSVPKQQMKDYFAWEKKPLVTSKCCSLKEHVAHDCYSFLREDRIQWRQLVYAQPGDKPLTRKEQQRLQLMEDQFEE